MKPVDGKKMYEKIEIPAELKETVNQAISSRSKEEVLKMREQKTHKAPVVQFYNKNNGMYRAVKYVSCAAAGLLVCLTVGVNASESFAMEVHQLPVIGQLAKVLTVRSWHETKGDYEYNIEVPEIVKETKTAGFEEVGLEAYLNPGFTADINAKIEQIAEDYTVQAQADMEAYKEAFFAAGGTKEEWNDRTMDIYVDYDVKYHQGNILSLELTTAKTWVASEEERHYYNLDLENDRYLTLEDLLGEDYIQIATDSIIEQINARITADESQAFFGYGPNDDGMVEGFTELSPEAMYYINEAGNVVIVFQEYEIAPGYMGFPEFEIQAE